MVISGVNTVTYNGDGITTAWPYTFPVTDDSEIRVQLNNADGTAVIIDSDYYVDLVNSTVYYPGYAPGSEPPEADQPPKVQEGQTITVYREIPITQEADLGDKWPFEVIEKGLDKLTMIAQQIDSGTNRAINNALASMKMLAYVVVDSGKLQHITDQLNEIDSKVEEAEGFADAAADSESNALSYKNAAAGSATDAAASEENAQTILNAILNSYGYPFTAATAADMTDTTKIYVYVGSEAGYTPGDWYYYNGASWVSGGSFTSLVSVDPTLTISGAAADAEVTGDGLKKKADLELLQVLGIEPKTDAITFTFVTNGTGSLSESNGDYIITGQTDNTNVVAAYTELGGYNSYIIVPYQYDNSGTLIPALNSLIFPFYKNGNDIYGFRFNSASEIRIQKYNISTFTGSQVASITKTHGWTSGTPLLITIDGNDVSLYANNNLLYKYNFSSLVAVSGVTVAGYISTAYNRPLSNNSKVAFNGIQIFNYEYNIAQIAEDAKTALNTTNLLKRGYHFSFDDVILVFQDLTTNAGVYSSIFDNSFLADLKNLHDAYGSCFSLYCFYQDAASNPTFTLSDATNAFASEFSANADWLRFGFHSYAPSTSYESGSTRENMIASDYDTVITQLIRITGSINCIDRIPRLHNYAGSLTACKAIRDTQCGVVGLLSAAAYSDVLERDSYYFDTDQNAYMAKHYKYYDAINSLVFIKTVYGVNSISTTNNYVKTKEKANMRDFMELFLHENQWTSGMKTMWTNIATTLAENGYVSNFYMDRLI